MLLTFNILGSWWKEKNGKEKETVKAKKVDKLRITFDLDENRISTSGVKDLYISITAPDGTPVAVEALGSGKFTTRDGQDKFFYTQNWNQLHTGATSDRKFWLETKYQFCNRQL